METAIEKISFNGWSNCLRVRHNDLELIIASSFGPRILSFGFIGKTNFFYLEKKPPPAFTKNKWRIYGGHRLWHAPEAMPRTYCPDNDPVKIETGENGLLITQKPEQLTGVQKEIEISFLSSQNIINVTHRLTNRSRWPVQLAPWSLSVLRGNGTIIAPASSSRSSDDPLQPNRSLALWPFTNLADKRWKFTEKYIFASANAAQHSEQKLGFSNPSGWMAYLLGEEALIKTFEYKVSESYPDFGSSSEIYMDRRFIEMETLGPLCTLQPGHSTQHIEHWSLEKFSIKLNEKSVDKILVPRIHQIINLLLN